MSRRRKPHYPSLGVLLNDYAIERDLEFHIYSLYHMRLIDDGYIVLDVWTTGRYYVMTTDYLGLGGKGIVERGGEKGMLPAENKLTDWLDKLFYAVEIKEQQHEAKKTKV